MVEVGNGKPRATESVVSGKACPNTHQAFSRVRRVAGVDNRFLNKYGNS